MTLDAGDLVLCSGTLARDASFPERIDAAVARRVRRASRCGAATTGAARREGLSDADIRARARPTTASRWPSSTSRGGGCPGAADVHIPGELDTEELFAYDEAELFRIAGRGGRAFAQRDRRVRRASGRRRRGRRVRRACAIAPPSTACWCTSSSCRGRGFPNVAAAWEIVRRADRPNGGMLVDAWHYFRSGADARALRAVPGRSRARRCNSTTDPHAAEADLPTASLHERLLPGAGELDLAGLLRGAPGDRSGRAGGGRGLLRRARTHSIRARSGAGRARRCRQLLADY